MKTLNEFEDAIEAKLLSFPKKLESNLTKLEDYKFNLNKTEITEAIIQRMRVYSNAQSLIKVLLNKRYAAPASDFFVETVAFYVSAYLKSRNSAIEVHSERQIKPKRGFMRPDISLWIGDEVVGIIECKTQLGYNRDNWASQQIERKNKLNKVFPKAKAWLVVFSSSNWNGFEDDPLVNKEYFTLANIHMRGIEKGKEKDVILNTIENLLKQL
jgi:hypothetical protein